jgi:RHS repeat-associated protein
MYQFDTLGNLYSRRSGRSNTEDLTETFDYDGLNRLVSAVTNGLSSGTRIQSYQYDVLGNITYKSDVGSYTYGATCASGGFGPHAVCETSGTVNASYGYDTSGNMTTNKNRTLTYSSYNKPLNITEGTTQTNFSYNANHSRYKQVKNTSAGTVTTYYMMGGQYEEITDLGKGETKYKSYLDSFGAHIVTEVIATAQTTEELQYYHRDHLGSTEAITDEQGVMVERFLFDPSGNRRDSDWEELPPAVQQAMSDIAYETTSQGFTGHEQLDSHNLTHMGGRIYDPVLGRFMSVDPFIQLPGNTQNYNRYSYVLNNPLSYTDPTGYSLDGGGTGILNGVIKLAGFSGAGSSDPYRELILRANARVAAILAARAKLNADAVNASEDGTNMAVLMSYSGGNDSELSTVVPESVSGPGLGEGYIQNRSRISGSEVMAGALVISGVLLGDDVTVVGVADDIAIPFVLVGGAIIAGGVIIYNAVSDDDSSTSDGKTTVPGSTGPPGEHVEGPRRGREYGPDGKPVRDYDKPHQGHDSPHVHEWPGGIREHPGREYSPWPVKAE